MLFNSLDFALFLPIVFLLYWFVTNKNLKVQNALIVAASYLFYGWWDPKFLTLIVFSTFVDYIVGRNLGKQNNPIKRKLLLWISILVNLGFLSYFKYANFFIENFVVAFSFFGSQISTSSLNIILPVGISFYTFQTMSYTIDVYRNKLAPTKDLIAFSAYVSFFPQLVAGPIERATQLLPQFIKARRFDYSQAVNGMKQICWGLFKKVVIADNCAEHVNLVFSNYSDYSGSTLFIAGIFFAFQIYGDFSGYSDIAIGTARLFGFNLMQNFAFPYFSRDIAEFWRRWHISLSTWFRDYLYIPLGGSRGGIYMVIRNTFIIFIVSGFWHGANWTFIVWGLLNALYILPLIILNINRNNLDIVAKNRVLPNFKEFFLILFTFVLTVLAWIFFRADNLSIAIDIVSEIFSYSLFTGPEVRVKTISLLVGFFVIAEWIGRRQKFAIENLGKGLNKILRYTLYFILVISIFWFGGEEQQFIYFQF